MKRAMLLVLLISSLSMFVHANNYAGESFLAEAILFKMQGDFTFDNDVWQNMFHHGIGRDYFGIGLAYNKLLSDDITWNFEINYLLGDDSGYGFSIKTGPMFPLLKTGTVSDVFVLTNLGFKGIVITWNNSVGDFFVPVITFDALFIPQFALYIDE